MFFSDAEDRFDGALAAAVEGFGVVGLEFAIMAMGLHARDRYHRLNAVLGQVRYRRAAGEASIGQHCSRQEIGLITIKGDVVRHPRFFHHQP